MLKVQKLIVYKHKSKSIGGSMTSHSQADLVQEIFNLPESDNNVTIINGVEHKVCFATKGRGTGCGRRLPITEFHFRNTAKGIRQNQCNDCKNEKDLKHRAIAIKIKKSFIKRIEAMAQCIVKDCSAKNTYKVDWLHFDHIAPETKNGRKDEISWMVKGKNKSTLEDLLNEIHKTNIVCHVHHAWHTKMQQSLNPKYEYYMVTKDSIERVAELGNWRYSIFRKKKNDRIVLQAYQETLENEDLSKVVRWS